MRFAVRGKRTHVHTLRGETAGREVAIDVNTWFSNMLQERVYNNTYLHTEEETHVDSREIIHSIFYTEVTGPSQLPGLGPTIDHLRTGATQSTHGHGTFGGVGQLDTALIPAADVTDR